MTDGDIDLERAIRAVRDGLAAAQQEGELIRSPVRFHVEEISIEMSVEFREARTTALGVKAYVVTGDKRGERSDVTAHRLSVKLKALQVDQDGRPVGDLLVGEAAGPGPVFEPLPGGEDPSGAFGTGGPGNVPE